jgi:integrase
VRWILNRYVNPWFAPQTDTLGDITYFMVHAWLLRLAGRPRADPGRGARDGDGALRPVGLSQPVIADALWALRGVLAFARATGIVAPGFDPTQGRVAPALDPATARTKPPTRQPRPLTLPECARIASRLHPVHQLALWLQRVMGLRISEAFGVLVDDVIDVIDDGDTGLLLVRGQGGRTFRVRDADGTIATVWHTERLKTAAAYRALVIPARMLELLRVAIEAFHTDADTGDARPEARLIPGLRAADQAGQLAFRQAFARATAAEGLGSADLGFRVTPHLLRKSIATDIAWRAGIQDGVRRRFMGHRAADDVYGRIYTLDHPELAPMIGVAQAIDAMIDESIGTLLVPTGRRAHWAHGHPARQRADEVRHVIDAAGWTLEPGDVDNPLCDTRRVAGELGVALTTARRWMHDGTVPCVTTSQFGRRQRMVQLRDVWSLRDRLADRILLPDLAVELGIRYHEIYQLARRMGLDLERHPTSRQFEIPMESAQRLRQEHERVMALHARSMKIAVAARELGLAVSTVGLMAKRRDIDLDSETDSSGARFVTRASVNRYRNQRGVSSRVQPFIGAAVPLANVIRFTGRSRTELLDLVRAGILEQVPGRRSCELTAASLQAWMTGSG